MKMKLPAPKSFVSKKHTESNGNGGQVSHLMSVSSCPEGKTTMLRANVMVVAGLVSLFGEAAEDEQSEDGGDYGGSDGAVQGAVKYIPAVE